MRGGEPLMNNKFKLALASLGSLSFAIPAFANPSASQIGFSSGFVGSTLKITSLMAFIQAIIQVLFLIAGLLVFIYLIWGGLQWLTSGGDSSKTQAARDRITAALVGLAIIAIAYAIMTLVTYFLGFGGNYNTPTNIPTPY